MNLDPDLLRLLGTIPAEVPKPVDWAAARLAHKAMQATLAGPDGLAPVQSVEQHRIDGPDGVLELRVYRPDIPAAMTVIHFHGGGWVAGDLDTTDHTARWICHRMGSIVVSCTYRMAPESPFPAAYDDALAQTRWVLSNIEMLGGDPHKVVIAGDSAGGNLVAAVTIALRDEARQAMKVLAEPLPALRAQLLLYPGVDLRDGERETPSYLADRDPSMRAGMVEECIAAYVQCGSRADWRVSPLAAVDLCCLPPAMVVVLSVDPLRDSAVHYAARLQQAGVVCELVEYPHLTHGFCHIGALVPAAGAAFDDTLARFTQFVGLGGGAQG